MGQNIFDPNDQRLTAYVFGEPNEAEQSEVEQLLDSSSEARAALAEIEETVRSLENGFATEEDVALNSEQREVVEAACLTNAAPSIDAAFEEPPVRRRWAAVVFGTVSLAAASVAVSLQLSTDADSSHTAQTNPSVAFDETDKYSEDAIAYIHEQELRTEVSSTEASHFASGDNEEAEFIRENVSIVSAAPEEQSGKNPSRVAGRAKEFRLLGDGDSSADKPTFSGIGGGGASDVSSSSSATKLTSTVGNKSRGVKAGADATTPVEDNFAVKPKPSPALPVTRGSESLTNRGKFTQQAGQTSRLLNQSEAKQVADKLKQAAPQSVSGAYGKSVRSQQKKLAQSTRERTRRMAVKGKVNDGLVTDYSTVAGPAVIATDGAELAAKSLVKKEVQLARKNLPEAFQQQVQRYYQQLSKIQGRLEQEGRPSVMALFEGESYDTIVENKFLSPKTKPLSTFGVDVDSASYSNVRRMLNHHQWPNPNAVRIEEMVNYFRYDYAEPTGEHPFAVHIETGTCPWQPDHRLVRIGLKGKEIDRTQRPPSNLVFLLDVSGSMRDAKKLPLVKQSMQMLVKEMTEDDRIAIVTYAGDAGVKLASTMGSERDKISAAIDALKAGGSTNGEAGLRLAYAQAVNNFIKDGTNRIILCSDGDFNVGVSDDNELVKMIENKAQTDVFLSIFGFGMGNIKDSKLEKLADKGNGHYGYIDSIRESRKVFIEEMTGTLYTIAKDVKLQVEFNPGKVGAYRLIGYENRVMAAQDFNDDTKDSGDIGAGHTVTALYEIIPPDKLPKPPTADALRYQKDGNDDKPDAEEKPEKPVAKPAWANELLNVKLNYKQPDGDQSTRLKEYPVIDDPNARKQHTLDFQWASSVASFGMLLRDSEYKGDANFDQVLEMANASRGADKSGHRREFIHIVYNAKQLWRQMRGLPSEPPKELATLEAEKRATKEGKYTELLKTVASAGDWKTYGDFNDYGYWGGNVYAGQKDLPAGYWVYVYPNWYIWKNQKDAEANKPQ